MPDNLTPAQRSYCMSRVKARGNGLERTVAAALRSRGLRFRLNVPDLPGRPDVVFAAARLAVFIDGDFWHGYRFPTWRHTVSSFWQRKIEQNRARDTKNHAKLRRRGWLVVRLWQHDIRCCLAEKVEHIATLVQERECRPTAAAQAWTVGSGAPGVTGKRRG